MAGTEQQSGMRIFSVPVQAGKSSFWNLALAIPPIIIKYPFWQVTAKNPNATYACINQGQAVCPQEIKRQSVCINADIGQVLQSMSDAAIE